MRREEALELLKKHVKNERMIAHSIASEAVMRKVALRLGHNPGDWGLAGLLHDVDVEVTNADAMTHGQVSRSLILEVGQIHEDIIEAIELHNEMSAGKPRSTIFHHALAASETVTGLITATALVYPDKKIASVKVKSVVKRMKEKHFAASVKRENIMECEKIGLSLDEFVGISLEAMTEISDQLGM